MDKAPNTYQSMDPKPPVFDYPSGPSSGSLLQPDAAGGGIAFSVPAENHRSSRFHHIADLDRFFSRVYRYHQRNGYFCMLLQESLELIQLAYVVIFSTFLLECVEFEVLFADRLPSSWFNSSKQLIHNCTVSESGVVGGCKVKFADAVLSTEQCLKNFSTGIIVLIIVAAIFWFARFVKVLSHVFSYAETRRFYRNALKIEDTDLANLTWHEVLQRLLHAQKIHHMCIHKPELTELDVYHRILRVENYLVAMINKNVIPVSFRVPFLGDVTIFTKIYLKNLDYILFCPYGLGAPLEQNWQLREEYKLYGRRLDVAEKLRKRIEYIALFNFVCSPFVLFWRILYAFFDYADIVKRDPGALGARRWSYYGRYFLRHFNEVDHELDARLRRAYKPATQYMNIFTSPALVILAKNMTFIFGSLLAVLVICAVIDEDFLKVSHVLTIITVLGVTVTICRACIPDENAVFNPDVLLSEIVSETHYAPETWKGRAHTTDVRHDFSQLFQYRFVHICEELLSPIITPFILFFALRNRCLTIVDFFRNFTVELVGVGDVCSFAEMDIRKHGDPAWEPDDTMHEDRIVDGEEFKADYGKTELSLIHFKLTNPEWKPTMEAMWFMQKLREQVEKGVQELAQPNTNVENNSVLASLSALGPRVQGIVAASVLRGGPEISRGGVNSQEGSLSGSGNAGLLNSVMGSAGVATPPAVSGMGSAALSPLELTTADMSFSALFLHEIHRNRVKSRLGQYGRIGEEEEPEDASTRPAGSSSARSSVRMYDEEEEGMPLLNLKK
ncbi:autophagy-related protein 9A-like [Paramacrobiotus metropolitanus]|uniref:autophagy-related protein 9A-like n=1 Tax=Paramacrobiotus metropolitanus TaxID=2943436 RepID=UPI002445841C|nr:autophagy-related protein 9A-like [Paramacrobiotus metropolitanus]XP_055329014.1 autophagy-related protein 9A-like [Paramacrobiotus metropolitanus]XP_055329015.1 autophagy-related protein 9A-like [Paramacrobiotus metropolitanus]